MLKKRRFSLAIATLALGLLLSVQYQTQQAALKDLTNLKQEDLVKVLSSLADKKNNLTTELWNLRIQRDNLVNNASEGNELVHTMKNDLNRLQMLYGATAVRGPGILITIPEQENSITAEELVSIVNELWNIGTEGISINGIRITSYTKIGEHPDTLETSIDGQELGLPYAISAIGDPDKLATTVAFAGGTIEQLRSYDKMIITIDKKDDIMLPIARQPGEFKYAQVVEERASNNKQDQ